MSSAGAPGGRPRRRDRFLAPFSSRTRGRSPSPSASSSTVVSTSTPASILSSPPVVSSTISLPPSLPSGSNLPPPVTTSVAPTTAAARDILNDAWQRLSSRERETLQPFILPAPTTTTTIGDTLERCLDAAKGQQRAWENKRMVFTIAGRDITLREQADKIVRWLDRFKAVGDIVVNVDPVHAGLPWAGVRLLLEVAGSENKQMASLLVGCETALYIINRLKAYMDFLSHLPMTLTRTNFETALTEMYTHILAFLARAIKIYQRSTVSRVATALWQDSDVNNFEQECDKLGARLDIEASNCDRTLAAQDRGVLDRALKEIEQIHTVQATLTRMEKKMDLSRLRVVEGAMFDAYGQIHHGCHPATRVDLLATIQDWAQQLGGKSIFWLNGGAGTGKSTISWTVAKWLADQGSRGIVDLGASFFFKRGEGDRGSAALFFPTIASQLATKLDGYDVLLAHALEADSSLCSKSMGEQFDKLLRGPLRRLPASLHRPSYVIVVDALDECQAKDIRTLLTLWSELPSFTNVSLRLFLTSRPDMPVLRGFADISITAHLDVNLHDETQLTIQHDLLVYLRASIGTLRNEYNRFPWSGTPLDDEWPGDNVLQELAGMATPLFIIAATIYRYISDESFDPRQRLITIKDTRRTGHMSQIAQTYLPVLQQILASGSDRNDRQRICNEFRMVVGAIVTLATPLSRTALATLLHEEEGTIQVRLQPLRSVLAIPSVATALIRPLHLSFGEFLTSEELKSSDELQVQLFAVDGPGTHDMLWRRCLQLLSGPDGLRENICGLGYPGQPVQDVNTDYIHQQLPPAQRYACQHWVYHLQHSTSPLVDGDAVHVFLQAHLLHWLEALSLLGRLADVIKDIGILQRVVSPAQSTGVSAFLEDARRFILTNRYIVERSPLQVYSSAVVFAPQDSIVRRTYGQVPRWIQQAPITPPTWSLELQTLHGHTSSVQAVAFSHDGSLLASASDDQTVRLWNSATGQELQTLQGHTSSVTAVAFSHDSSLLASASYDQTVRLWNPATGQELQTLQGHTDYINAVAFSHDSSLLASASRDQTVRLWNPATGQELQTLQGHTDYINAVAFSHDSSLLASASRDQTVRLWNPATGQEVKTLENLPGVHSIEFAIDGTALLTNRGRIGINTVAATPAVSNSIVHNDLVLQDDWIEHSGEKLMWLPQEYRSGVSAAHGDLLAIGRRTGHVIFIRISPSLTQRSLSFRQQF